LKAAEPTRYPDTSDGQASAADRWRALVHDRLNEMAALSPERGVGPRFWNSRAPKFAARLTVENAAKDPFFRRLRRASRPGSSLLDVGAGPGRFSLNLAAEGRIVTAVDPSPGMLRILRREATARGLASRIVTVLGSWEEVKVQPAEVAFSSYVLPMVEDAPGFLAKLSAAAQDEAFLYLGAFSMDAVLDPLWRHFHGASRRPGPTYLDALAVLRELGAAPEVAVVELPNRTRFASVAEAAKEYADFLLLPPGRAVQRDLERLLADWLISRDGQLEPPLRYVPAAIIQWPGSAVAPAP
jgi:SAM-dependent methyltransferase